MTGGCDFASALLFVTVFPVHDIVSGPATCRRKYLHAPDVVFFRPRAVTLPSLTDNYATVATLAFDKRNCVLLHGELRAFRTLYI